MHDQNIYENAARILYGSKTKKEKEQKNLRNSLLNELGNKLTPAQTLYSSINDLKKMKEKQEGKITGLASSIENNTNKNKIKGMSTGFGLPVDGKDPGMTPMRDFISRQEYLKQGMCKLNDKKMIFGVNACSATPIDNRELSPKTYAKLREFLGIKEDFRDTAYQDKGGVWTIGYGHTKNVKPGDKITKEQAEKLFEEDMKIHIDSLKHVKPRLTENQKAALASLIYNTGGTNFYHSKMLKKLNAYDIKGAADEFDDWIKDKKNNIENGLRSRRKQEKEWFFNTGWKLIFIRTVNITPKGTVFCGILGVTPRFWFNSFCIK